MGAQLSGGCARSEPAVPRACTRTYSSCLVAAFRRRCRRPSHRRPSPKRRARVSPTAMLSGHEESVFAWSATTKKPAPTENQRAFHRRRKGTWGSPEAGLRRLRSRSLLCFTGVLLRVGRVHTKSESQTAYVLGCTIRMLPATLCRPSCLAPAMPLIASSHRQESPAQQRSAVAPAVPALRDEDGGERQTPSTSGWPGQGPQCQPDSAAGDAVQDERFFTRDRVALHSAVGEPASIRRVDYDHDSDRLSDGERPDAGSEEIASSVVHPGGVS